MRGPSLQRTAALSFALHITVLFLAVLTFRQSNHMVMPDAYTVNLVSPNVLPQIDKAESPATVHKTEPLQKKEPAPASKMPRKNIKENTKENIKEDTKGRESVEEKISLLAAKKRVEKQFGSRKVISLKAGGEKLMPASKVNLPKGGPVKAVSSPGTKGGSSSDDYYSKVVDEIRQQWVWASRDSGRRNIEAIVSIKILKDGTAVVQKVEKSSGNTLFDKSALRALAKASPLPPPPYEIEIGVRFYP
jgi:colicin import membrane protein